MIGSDNHVLVTILLRCSELSSGFRCFFIAPMGHKLNGFHFSSFVPSCLFIPFFKVVPLNLNDLEHITLCVGPESCMSFLPLFEAPFPVAPYHPISFLSV